MSSEGVQVLHKATALLRELGDGTPMSAAELATALGQPRTTVYRLLNTLIELGWVQETHQRGRFALDVGMFATARGALDCSPLRLAAISFMRALRNRTQKLVLLTVRRGTEAICIERMDGSEVYPVGMQLGGRLPLHAGAGPRVLLALSSPAVIQAWEDEARANGEAKAITPHTLVDIEAITNRLQLIRARGYELSMGDSVVGLGSVAAPVIGPDGVCVAAITLAGRSEDVTGETGGTPHRDLVIATAKALSDKLARTAPTR
ncbi:IclR family transcriptional regulator [Georgenia sp. EYE_87]|uniref:IclR family transcriptional regulator n=1 Tax=Georgenia sp. EYE_87 TaxID=2853448 RepID=UPI002004A1F2|nr:IclR family transcriptional regulator [Georgenia sp. EYE_87]MCK6210067.1 IclR family transcriptional regulator [Georgenia sp. EYE_87]